MANTKPVHSKARSIYQSFLLVGVSLGAAAVCGAFEPANACSISATVETRAAAYSSLAIMCIAIIMLAKLQRKLRQGSIEMVKKIG